MTSAKTTTQFIIVDWLPPDFGAVGQYAHLAAINAAEAGASVCLIGLTSGARTREERGYPSGGRLRTIRLAARATDKSSYLARLVWAWRTNLRLIRTAMAEPDITRAEVRFTGSPPFMLFFALALKGLRRVRLTYRITDFYPEVVIAAAGRASLALKLLQAVTWWARRRVDRFEAIGEDQKRLLLLGGVPPERIAVVRDVSPVEFGPDARPAAPPEPLRGRPILLYSGNYGVAHDAETVREGLALHHRRGGDFALWINGTGAEAGRLSEALTAAGAPVAFTPPAPLDKLASILVAADAHLITLKAPFSGIVLPSKVYGCLASGRPILFVGPESSDVHLLCEGRANGWYRRVDPGDAEGFATALDALAGTLRMDALRTVADA